MDATLGLPNIVLKILLACGILSAVVYIGTDIIAGLLRPGYNFITTTANLLVAYDSPTRSFVLPLTVLAQLLLLTCTVGIWLVAGANWGLRVLACLLAGNAILSILAGLVYPWHAQDPLTIPVNQANLALMASSVVLFLLAVVTGIFANHDWMRSVSIGVIAAFILLAVYSILRTRLAGGTPPQPLIGIQERVMFYTELIWLSLQVTVLIHRTVLAGS